METGVFFGGRGGGSVGASPLLTDEQTIMLSARFVRHVNPRNFEYETGLPTTSLYNSLRFGQEFAVTGGFFGYLTIMLHKIFCDP
jgi:hypothetical protein